MISAAARDQSAGIIVAGFIFPTVLISRPVIRQQSQSVGHGSLLNVPVLSLQVLPHRPDSQVLELEHYSPTMWILPLLGYLGAIAGFAFLTLAIGKYNRRRPDGDQQQQGQRADLHQPPACIISPN